MVSGFKMELTIFVISVTFGLVMSAGSSTFEPGCSFIGGQCMYTVKLGHEGQCDKVSPGTSGCCDDMTKKYDGLVDDIENLKTKVNLMAKAMDASKNTNSAMEKDLENALKERDDIMNVLDRKEKELNSSKAEIQSLREDLANTKMSLKLCQTSLGNEIMDESEYKMTYYNFDGYPSGFKYSSKYMGLKRIGSSGSGPRYEHSTGVQSGFFLSINSNSIAVNNPHPSGSTYLAKSGTFEPADNYCLKFWYFMKGEDVSELHVNIEIQSDTGYPIFSRAGESKTDNWELAQISIDNEYTQFPFKIIINMTSKAYYVQDSSGTKDFRNRNGDIAVDDLYVYNTSCSSLPTHPDGAYQNTVNNSTSYYTFHSTPKTWFDAYDYCRRQGPMSALVSIETKEEQAFLVNIIKHDTELTTVGQNGFFTSGSDADSEQNFKWTNTGVQRDLDVSFWHPGQPNGDGFENCLLMEYPEDDYQWGDVDCSTKHPFICETTISA